MEELPIKTKKKERENSIENEEGATVKCYEPGQLLEETRSKMREIDQRNSDLKAKRESIHYSIEMQTLIDIENDASTDLLHFLKTAEQVPSPSTVRDRRSESIKPVPRKKLPPISRNAHSFNEFDHKRLSRQFSQQSDKSSSGSQTSLRDGSKRRFSSANGDKSMFTLKSKPHREPVGIVSHVTGDLSVKLTKMKPLRLQTKGEFDLEEYLAQIPKSEKGSTKLRPLSTDIRIDKSDQLLRRTKSSTPAMVLCSIKPDMSQYLKKPKNIGNLLESKPPRTNFKRAIMAVAATNRIHRSYAKVWRM